MFKIVLPTDFSKNSQRAIDYAIRLFKDETCTFYVLHAYHSVPSSSDNKITAKDNLKQLAQTLKTKDNPNHHFKQVLETDSVINLVNRTVIDKVVDFVFMGTKGSSATRELFIGGNTTDVLKYLVACPIIAIPNGYEYDLPEEIIFATDFKSSFKDLEMEPLTTIAKLRNSKLTVLHIRSEKALKDVQKKNKEQLKTRFKAIKAGFKEIAMEDTIVNTLHSFERKNSEIGMITLLNTKHGFFQKLLREPVIRNMTFHTKVPLLVLPIIE